VITECKQHGCRGSVDVVKFNSEAVYLVEMFVTGTLLHLVTHADYARIRQNKREC